MRVGGVVMWVWLSWEWVSKLLQVLISQGSQSCVTMDTYSRGGASQRPGVS